MTPVELLARLATLMHCARALLSPCSWTYVDSVQPAGLRPLRFHHLVSHLFATLACLHLTVPIGTVLCQRIRRANSLGAVLESREHRFEVVAIGGGSLLLLGLTRRPTKDISGSRKVRGSGR